MDIPLSTRLTPSQNAQSYYKKYRKAKVAEQYAREQLVPSSGTLRCWKTRWMTWTSAKPPPIWRGTLRAFAGGFPAARALAGARRQAKKLPEGKPCRFTAPDGTVIEVGKNSLQNDRLTPARARRRNLAARTGHSGVARADPHGERSFGRDAALCRQAGRLLQQRAQPSPAAGGTTPAASTSRNPPTPCRAGHLHQFQNPHHRASRPKMWQKSSGKEAAANDHSASHRHAPGRAAHP